MSHEVSKLFDAYDRGRLTRRQLFYALGLTVAAAPIAALAQQERGTGRGEAPRDTEPARLPFAPTGWTTVLLDHLTYEVGDYEKEAAYFNALMNWAVRSDTGTEAVLDIGDWGGMVIRGGYQPSPETVAAERAQYEQFQSRVPAAQRRPFQPLDAKFTNIAWGIEPWNAKTVEAELKKRGLNPVADNRGDFESFHVKDPDGFDVQITNGNRQNRRRTPAHASLKAAAPFPHTTWKTVWLDHLSFQVPDYKRSVAFYEALLGWKPGQDTGTQNQCEIGDVGDIIIRTFNRPGAPAPAGVTIGHIAFGIQPFDPDEVKKALDERKLSARVDTGTQSGDIHTSEYKSYHTQTPNGWDLQISATTRANRSAGASATAPRRPGER